MSLPPDCLPARALAAQQLVGAVVRLAEQVRALTARVAELEQGRAPPPLIVRGRKGRRGLAPPPI